MIEFRATIRFSDGGSQRVAVPVPHRSRTTLQEIMEDALDKTGIDEGHVIGFKMDLYRDGLRVT